MGVGEGNNSDHAADYQGAAYAAWPPIGQSKSNIKGEPRRGQGHIEAHVGTSSRGHKGRRVHHALAPHWTRDAQYGVAADY